MLLKSPGVYKTFLSNASIRTLSTSRWVASNQDSRSNVRIGCASGFWGDTPTATPQLIEKGKLNYLIYDYLSELTMSLLTAAKQKKPEAGFASDFIKSGIGPHLKQIKDSGMKVITNAGGINTTSCVASLQAACKKAGVDLKIAEVHGDNMIGSLAELQESNQIKEMFSQMDLPPTVHSMTAYFGAGPIVKALEMGADIVVTGRTADSALALAPLMHEYKWQPNDWDKLASGSLAGHLIECGGQATGGLFTDWKDVQGYDNLGFPVVEVSANGDILVTKPENTGGLLNKYTVAEQLLYEIGDPSNYILPDVNCDFSNVKMLDTFEGVKVTGAKGNPATENYKVCATYLDGFRAQAVALVLGGQADKKARKTADAIMKRVKEIFAKKDIEDFYRSHVAILGAEDHFGASKQVHSQSVREAVIWMGVMHYDVRAIDIWAKEIASSGTGMTPGLCGMVGGRPKPTPCLKLFSFLYPKSKLPATVKVLDQTETYNPTHVEAYEPVNKQPVIEEAPLPKGSHSYRLEDLAYARSGDKGNGCNIGVIARDPKYLPYIRQALKPEVVQKYFAHMFPQDEPDKLHVKRFDVPGIDAVNFLLENSLDGGGAASLRPDPLGKACGQMLLDIKIENVPELQDM